jgi:hypothetical protein
MYLSPNPNSRQTLNLSSVFQAFFSCVGPDSGSPIIRNYQMVGLTTGGMDYSLRAQKHRIAAAAADADANIAAAAAAAIVAAVAPNAPVERFDG